MNWRNLLNLSLRPSQNSNPFENFFKILMNLEFTQLFLQPILVHHPSYNKSSFHIVCFFCSNSHCLPNSYNICTYTQSHVESMLQYQYQQSNRPDSWWVQKPHQVFSHFSLVQWSAWRKHVQSLFLFSSLALLQAWSMISMCIYFILPSV